MLDIDASEALALPGVLAVLTAEDVPNNKVGHIQQDWDVMIAKGCVTRCVGDAVCLVVAESEAVLAEAKKLVKIDYEELEPDVYKRQLHDLGAVYRGDDAAELVAGAASADLRIVLISLVRVELPV